MLRAKNLAKTYLAVLSSRDDSRTKSHSNN
jgi:hypothetical protein